MEITHRPVHVPLFCVYDRAGDLIGAFPTMEAAQHYADGMAFGWED